MGDGKQAELSIKFMNAALKEAEKAALKDEVPVGAVAVCGGKIIARAHNAKEKKNDATAHAEIEVLKKASSKLKNWYLDEVEIYVTLEPCAMCAGAMINSRIKALYFGAFDPKGGACGSLYNLIGDKRLNHSFPVTGGLEETRCAALLTEFFRNKRK